ncbi:hypothetical protein [Methylophaga pinxianii]|uniref:hypothetical protein n=1 Tax=Methylophaga pinxianii TaxID=2881052 RepID=UPI001CF3B8B4|nr:hypothetical protein [Methylophaga pinxianii]MCB2427621.1 hypothetical protein [Methylophaga pinxianii]UPH46611.1 hypothetical protein LGT42_004830 [Methylophaga pinxianii]
MKRLVFPVLLALLLPLIASWFAYPDTHLPPDFGVFPPQYVADAPGFNLLVFCIIALAEILVITLYLIPALFGFKKVAPEPRSQTVALPIWFWIGLVVTLFFWWLMWSRVTIFGDLVYYAFTPMWWGFIFVLDGLVYRYSNRQSLFASKPKTFLMTAIVSLAGWYLFEYFNYFALGNWYYPNSTMPELSHQTIVIIFLLAYTTVWPAIFQWYTLLNTCPRLVSRFSQGPKISLNGNLLIWLGLIILVLMVFWPYPFFWALWIGPLLVFAGVLIRSNIWSPFSAMADGNWSPALLMALSAMLNGFFWEFWNYGSAHPAEPVTNPNYWVYDIPYINVIHIFSEMPLLGYMGYMPFGVLAWVIFIWAGKVFGFNTDLIKK